ncbi:MAG: hypothetical protein AABY11_03470, partial [archaeon]
SSVVPSYIGTPNTSVSSGIDLLSIANLGIDYSFNGRLVAMDRESQLSVLYTRNIADFNISFDLEAANYG